MEKIKTPMATGVFKKARTKTIKPNKNKTKWFGWTFVTLIATKIRRTRNKIMKTEVACPFWEKIVRIGEYVMWSGLKVGSKHGPVP
jgi:hypothetical protein